MALESYLNLRQMDLERQRVFLRLDLNMPLKDGKVLDDTRLQGALPTLEFLVEKGARVIVASHLGRPQTKEDHSQFSLEPVAHCLNQKGYEVLLMDSPASEAPYELTKGLGDRQIIMLENLRFDEGETQNSSQLAAQWSRYTDIYVNDAFGACHRAHASIEALARLTPRRCFGFLIEKELQALKAFQENPKRPFYILTGGSKVSDKLPLLQSLADQVDGVLMGGAMALTFLKAQGVSVGMSRVEKEALLGAKNFLQGMERAGKKVYLPLDHKVVQAFQQDDFTITSGPALQAHEMALDIGPQTQALYSQILKEAGRILWNGPMGVYERSSFAQGSLAMAEAMGEASAYTFIGGGDSAALAMASGLASHMDHISTGGGASLEFLQGATLPGLEALKVRRPPEEETHL